VVQPIDVGRLRDTGQGERLRVVPVQVGFFLLLCRDACRSGTRCLFYGQQWERWSLRRADDARTVHRCRWRTDLVTHATRSISGPWSHPIAAVSTRSAYTQDSGAGLM
jgi:hypothetical protein